jgi:hypothetical protein
VTRLNLPDVEGIFFKIENYFSDIKGPFLVAGIPISGYILAYIEAMFGTHQRYSRRNILFFKMNLGILFVLYL